MCRLFKWCWQDRVQEHWQFVKIGQKTKASNIYVKLHKQQASQIICLICQKDSNDMYKKNAILKIVMR